MNKGIAYSDETEKDPYFSCSKYILVNTVQDHICFFWADAKRKPLPRPNPIHTHDYNFFIISESKIIKTDKQMTFTFDINQSNRSFQYVKILQ